MRDDDIPAVGMFLYEFRLAVMSHVYHDVTFRFNYVVDLVDDIICTVGTNAVPYVYEVSSPRAEKGDALFQPADDVGGFAVPFYYFFWSLEMDDVINRV